MSPGSLANMRRIAAIKGQQSEGDFPTAVDSIPWAALSEDNLAVSVKI